MKFKNILLTILVMLLSSSFSQVNKVYMRDAWGTSRPMFATLDSSNVVSMVQTARKFELAVSMGQIPGHSLIDKFGSNPMITTSTDPEDVWEGGGLYNYDTPGTAPIVSFASSSALDTQVVKIQGLDVLGNMIEFIDTLNGTTRRPLDVGLWRSFRIENEGTYDFVGNVFVYTGTGTVPVIGDPEVRSVVINGNNQTLMAVYTIPNGYVGFLYRGEAGISYNGNPTGGETARIFYKSRRYGKVFKVKKEVGFVSSGSTIYQDPRSFPDVIPALTDIKINIAEVSDDMGVWATFDILLVEEQYFKQSFLTAIGQVGN